MNEVPIYNQYLDLSPEVKKALENNQPVVALESTIISHGMPYPVSYTHLTLPTTPYV